MAKRRTNRPARTKARRKDHPTTPAARPRPTGDHDIEFIARAAWLHGSRVLLARTRNKDYYALPGGHIEFGESAAAALAREILEETGERITPVRLVLVSEGTFQTRKRWHHEFNLVFHVEHAGSKRQTPPTIRSREKDLTFEWIELAAAVDLDIRPLAVKAWLAAGAGAGTGIDWVSEIPR